MRAMAESPALLSVHAARRAVTRALAGDVPAAARELADAPAPEHSSRALLGIALAAIRTAADAEGIDPEELWQALAARQAGVAA